MGKSFSDREAQTLHWLVIAMADEAASDGLLQISNFENALYHMQQSSEKMLKAYVYFHTGTVSRIHDISSLLLEAAQIDASLVALSNAGIGSFEMSTLATQYRYPGSEGFVYTDEDQITGASQFMQQVHREIASRLPETLVTAAKQRFEASTQRKIPAMAIQKSGHREKK